MIIDLTVDADDHHKITVKYLLKKKSPQPEFRCGPLCNPYISHLVFYKYNFPHSVRKETLIGRKKREGKEKRKNNKQGIRKSSNYDGGVSVAVVRPFSSSRRGRDCGGVVALRSPYLPSPSERLREEWWRGKERRLLKVGGKFGSAAKLTELSSPLLKRNFAASL